MITRSAASKQTIFVQLPYYRSKKISIDFDDAHDEWIANKKRLANGQYVYLCGKTTGTGSKCKRGCHDMIGLYSGCKIHFMWEENENSF